VLSSILDGPGQGLSSTWRVSFFAHSVVTCSVRYRYDVFCLEVQYSKYPTSSVDLKCQMSIDCLIMSRSQPDDVKVHCKSIGAPAQERPVRRPPEVLAMRQLPQSLRPQAYKWQRKTFDAAWGIVREIAQRSACTILWRLLAILVLPEYRSNILPIARGRPPASSWYPVELLMLPCPQTTL
jgi:hypothetical protein